MTSKKKAQETTQNKGGRAGAAVVSRNAAAEVAAIKSQVHSALVANRDAEVSVREARILSAEATYQVEQAGLVGKAGEWDSWNDYAEKGLGLSKSSATGLRRMGKALAMGLDPRGKDSEVWSVLSDKAGTKAVGEIMAQERLTVAKIRTGLKRLAAGQPAVPGVSDAEGGSKAPKSSGGTPREDSDTRMDLPRSHSALLDVIEAAWAKIDQDRLSPAERKRVAAIVETMGEVRTAPAVKGA